MSDMRILPDNTVVHLQPLTYERWRLCIQPPNRQGQPDTSGFWEQGF